jgi:hypothetical protein
MHQHHGQHQLRGQYQLPQVGIGTRSASVRDHRQAIGIGGLKFKKIVLILVAQDLLDGFP